ncbi:hypothetical protein V6N12_001929 [Hibiscus sabdariffa]|uniref:Uncharacterized protein n=1 Tax=Hibiscus sabdariffa TaxID=183260 RepID=A0ABR2BTL7_9ROSI
MNEERHARKGKAYWLVIMRPQFLTGGDTKGLRPSIPWIDNQIIAGALAGDPGCFPLDDEAYPPSSHWPTSTPVILRLAFATAPVGSLNQATAYESPAHSSTGTRSEPWAPPTAWELTVSCSISLPDGVSFHPSLTQQFERLTYSGISGSTLIFNSPKHFVAYYALPRLWVPRILLVPEDPATGEPGTESFPPSDSLVLRMLVLRMRFYGRSATPGYRRRPWGDLVVPTGWRRWGWSMDFPSFCRISLKGLKGDSASSCSQGPT